MRTETEARYSLPAPDLFDRLRVLDHIDRYTLGPCRPSQVVDTYLDTAGCDLAQQGWACRLRSDENGWTLTLKGPRESEGAVVSRAELETPLPEAILDPRRWPTGPWRDEALRLLGEQSLSPWLTLRQARDRYTLSEGDRAVAELTLDTVDLTEHGPRVYLVECELLATGRTEDLQRIAATLERNYGLTPEPHSKLELALAAQAERNKPAEPAPAPEQTKDSASSVRPEDTIGLAAGKVIERYLNTMLAHEEGTRLGADPEELHDMRVATRRLRSVLRLLRPYLHSAVVGTCEVGLRNLGIALGAVRDLDVALGHANDYARQVAGDSLSLQPLIDDWTSQRAAARKRLLRYLGKKAYRRLLKRMRGLLADLGASPSDVGERYRVHSLVPRLIHVHWRAVLAYGQVAPGAPLGMLHQLRIECKRLRYALESFRDALPERLTVAIPTITSLQDHLGELHDAAVRVEWIDQWVAERGDLRGLEGVLAYRAACQARADELEHTFPEAWGRFARNNARERSALRLARLQPPSRQRRGTWLTWLHRASRP